MTLPSRGLPLRCVLVGALVCVVGTACSRAAPVRPVETEAESRADAATVAATPSAPPTVDAGADASVGHAATPDAGCSLDAGAPGFAACDLTTQACLGGTCVTCPPGTAAMTDTCERVCGVDSDCKSGEICSYLSPAYSFCTAKPPVPKCAPGEIALKTGTCFTPCKSDKDCARVGPGLCCISDPNAPTTICMGKCLP